MSEIDNLLNELINMRQEKPKFDVKQIWDGIAQRKDWNELGFTSKEQFEQFLNDNPYSNL